MQQEAGHKPSTGRCVVGLVLILLSERLVEEAEIVAREFGSNCSGEQSEIIEDLLDALDQGGNNSMDDFGPILGACSTHGLFIRAKVIFCHQSGPNIPQILISI